MFKAIFEIFLLFLAYKFIFEFIVPLWQTTKQVKQKMGEMQQQLNRQQQQNKAATAKPTPPPPPPRSKNEDYIEFEEVK